MNIKIGHVLKWEGDLEYVYDITDRCLKVTYFDSYDNRLSSTSFDKTGYSDPRRFVILTDIFIE